MKPAIVAMACTTVLMLGACSHTGQTVSRTAPVTSLTEAEIRAELAAISQELDLVGSRTRESMARETVMRRMAMLASRHADSTAVRPLELQVTTTTPRYTYIERLLRRREALRAQLARLNPPQS